jgi:hypothetical protein
MRTSPARSGATPISWYIALSSAACNWATVPLPRRRPHASPTRPHTSRQPNAAPNSPSGTPSTVTLPHTWWTKLDRISLREFRV